MKQIPNLKTNLSAEMSEHVSPGGEMEAFREAFDAFDWKKNGKISYGNLQVREVKGRFFIFFFYFLSVLASMCIVFN